jgi:hypothetical protein
MRLIRREALVTAPGVEVGVCDGCRRMFPVADLTWSVQTWQTADLHYGSFTGTLCEECDRYAWSMCWSCGTLTPRLDGRCDECEGVG